MISIPGYSILTVNFSFSLVGAGVSRSGFTLSVGDSRDEQETKPWITRHKWSMVYGDINVTLEAGRCIIGRRQVVRE